METASSEQRLSNTRMQSYINHEQHQRDDTYSFSSARLRSVTLSKTGSLLVLSIILAGCGIAMVMMGIALWSDEQETKGIAIAGVIVFSIGVGIGAGAWYLRKKAKYEREHRMPVVTISLSQQTVEKSGGRGNDYIEGEYNAALDLPPEYALTKTPGSSGIRHKASEDSTDPNYYSIRNPVQTTQNVQETVLDIRIHSPPSTSVTTRTMSSSSSLPSTTRKPSNSASNHYHNFPDSYTPSPLTYGSQFHERQTPSLSSTSTLVANETSGHSCTSTVNSQRIVQDPQHSTRVSPLQVLQSSPRDRHPKNSDAYGSSDSIQSYSTLAKEAHVSPDENADPSLNSSDLDISVASDDVFVSREESPLSFYSKTVVNKLDPIIV